MPACVSADGGHFAHMMWTGWSRLIWDNFVKVADNLIKIRSLVWIWMHNRHVKFGRKIPNRFRKIAQNCLKTLGGGIFLTHTVHCHHDMYALYWIGQVTDKILLLTTDHHSRINKHIALITCLLTQHRFHSGHLWPTVSAFSILYVCSYVFVQCPCNSFNCDRVTLIIVL